MKSFTDKPIDVPLSIASRELSHSDRIMLMRTLAGRLLELVDDLGLPTCPSIALELKPRNDPLGAIEFEVRIDGRYCRQPRALLPQDNLPGVGALANRIARIIYLNRGLLLTNHVISQLRGLSKKELSTVVPFLISRGSSLKYASELVQEVDQELSGDALAYALELALANRFPRVVTLEASTHLYEIITCSSKEFGNMLGMMRDGLFYELGIKIPGIRLFHGVLLGSTEFRLHIGGVRGPVMRTLGDNEFLVNETPAGLRALVGIVSKNACNPANGSPSAIVIDEDMADRCQAAGLTTWRNIGYLILSMAADLRAHADIFFTITKMETTLSRLAEVLPLPIVNIMERFSPTHIIAVLRSLLRENVSIRDLRSVMEAMLEINGQLTGVPDKLLVIAPPVARLSRLLSPPSGDPCPEDHAAYVRLAMKRHLTRNYSGAGVLYLVETTDFTENRFRRAAGQWSPEEHRDFVQVLADTILRANQPGAVAILTAYDIRRRLREAIAIEFPHVHVFSREEIRDTGPIKICAAIEWADPNHPARLKAAAK